MFKPGLRNIKTALAMTITASILMVIDSLTPYEVTFFYGAIAALFGVQNTTAHSFKMGGGRIIGSFVGTFVCLGIFLIDPNLLVGPEYLPLMFLAVIISIQILTILKIPTGVTAACIMVAASFSIANTRFVAYSLIRCLETVIGVVVGLLVNVYVFPYDANKNSEG